MPIQDFTLLQQLGKGSFGTVHKCVRKTDHKVYAIKQVKFQQLKQKDKQNALNEIRLLASIQNPFIIAYKQAFYDQTSRNLCIIMQYANQGDLHAKIKTNIKQDTRFKQSEIWKTACHLLRGCKKLHDLKIIHRDIKSANIFYSEGVAKLGDLNVSKYIQSNFAKTQTGTPYYASPEIWGDQVYGAKCDIWSVGIVIYEMCMLKPPFRAQTFEGLYRKIAIGQYQKINNYSNSLQNFISKCLTVDAKKRPSAEELLQSFHQLGEQKNLLRQTIVFQQNQQLLKTIKIPNNLSFLNEKLPNSKYQQQIKKKEKSKRTVVFQEITNKIGSPRRRQFPSIAKFRSEKHLPGIINSSKLIPSSPSQKDLGVSKTIIKIISSKGMNQRSATKQKRPLAM